jgi:rhodanese-related sulfurtransferase
MNVETEITVDEVKELMKGKATLFFLNVQSHRDRDWGVVKVRGALRVPDDEVERHIEEIPHDGAIIVCSPGAGDERGRRAVELLRQRGWTNAYMLVGGFSAYLEAGLPVEEFGVGSETRKIMFLS